MNVHKLVAWALGGVAVWVVMVLVAFVIRWDVVAALEAGTATAASLGVAALVQWWRQRRKKEPREERRKAKRPTP
ncbi:hypothetical protein HCN51_53090 [Nonomuraea sp. FMUSA5-5]|uniref:DUF2530 domain-containing protein n=1 Tax=Nonomuraea composti TaxID=2720023 RepID=A0ABX1BQJ9_9ACTN|nr:hypothetical protein [Nonomuraea sp. FMUSA5-5]NJP98071.1 hypothetical protein [Nonomuraea sp. FMUSA5-5]